MLTKVRLNQEWPPHAAGETVEVDELRAERLLEEGRGILEEDVVVQDPAADIIAAAGGAPWHSVNGEAYHTEADCTVGNNIEPENRREGTGGLKLCKECRKLARAAKKAAAAE